MKRKFYSVLTLLALSAGALFGQTTTFNFTGGIQTFTVPCGVDSVFIQTWGAQGGSGAAGNSGAGPTSGGAGGLGGYAEGWLMVTPGQTLNIFVGEGGGTPAAGFNGGGTAGSQNAGGGGGASDVRVNGTAESDRVITAGGGGGGGRGGCESGAQIAGGAGGSGGGGNGANGIDAPTSGGDAGAGAGGVGAAGGAAGIGCGGFLGAPGSAATTGTGGAGGAGQACCCFSFPSVPGGGGGGGGFVGGGGGGGGSAGTTGCSGNDKGAGGGGAGGSSDVSGVINGVTNSGIWLGNGQVSINWSDPIPAAAVITGTTSFCEGDSITLSISSDPLATFYTWTVDTALDFVSGQNTTSIVLAAGSTPGTYMVTAQAVNGTCSFSGALDTVMITVNALPTVTFSAMPVVCLDDDNVALTGSPAGGTFSGTAVTGNSFSPSTAGTGTYEIVYMYTDSATGCSNWASDSIMVDPCLGIASVVTNGISVSPNPASDVLNVSWNANTVVSTIRVMDVTGRVVMTESVSNGNTKQLNISSLPAGTYSVSVEGAEKTTYTFVKK